MKWFKNLRTSAKLISAFVVMALIVTAVGILSVSNLNMMKDHTTELYSNNLISVHSLGKVQIGYQNLRIAIRDIRTASTQAEKDTVAADVKAVMKDIENAIEAYRPLATTKPEQEELEKLDESFSDYVKLYDTAMQLAIQGREAEFVNFKDGELNTVGGQIRESLKKLIDMNVQISAETNRMTLHDNQKARTTTIAVIIASFLISIAMGYWIAQLIARPLNKMVTLVSKVSAGDLRESIDIDSKDEVGQLSKSINEMVASLKNLIGGILHSSQSLAAASEQISASTEEISGGSTVQAQSAQTISELFKEFSAAINSVTESAEAAAQLSNDTVKTANEGEGVVQMSVSGMQQVKETMSRLEHDSLKIGEIIEVIDDIADQTNLLALNAAIEAARAGDQGRGFAVVADEVRKLAERSSTATKEISSIIKLIQENTKQSVDAVLNGVAQSNQTGAAFQQIITMVNASSAKVHEIAAACEEEAAQASEVMRSIDSIAASSQETASATEETAATCQSLAQLADELQQSISIFKI